MKTIKEMQAEVDELIEAKGWKDKPVSFVEAMAMLHSEVSEALEAWRNWGLEDATDHETEAWNETRPKPEGVGAEFADVFIRLLDDCERFGVDLEAEYERKMAYNHTRPYRHGGKPI